METHFILHLQSLSNNHKYMFINAHLLVSICIIFRLYTCMVCFLVMKMSTKVFKFAGIIQKHPKILLNGQPIKFFKILKFNFSPEEAP